MLFKIKKSSFKFYHEHIVSIIQDLDDYYEYFESNGNILKRYKIDHRVFKISDIFLKIDEKSAEINTENEIYYKVFYNNEIFWIASYEVEKV